jgi:hypothetical protein
MIKFFRKIRQQLLTENRFSKYLIYAIGEIVLVVIGIVIALQLNIAQQNSSNQKKLNKYLSLFMEDLEKDKLSINECIELDSLKALYCDQYINLNTMRMNHSTLRYAAQKASIISHDATYTSMKSNGIMELIENVETQKAISEYYASVEQVKRQEDQHLSTQYSNFLKEIINSKRLVQFYHHMNTNAEFINLTKEEDAMLFGYIVHFRDISNLEVGRYKNLLDKGNELIKLLSKEQN